eukprot:ctg_2637.g459
MERLIGSRQPPLRRARRRCRRDRSRTKWPGGGEPETTVAQWWDGPIAHARRPQPGHDRDVAITGAFCQRNWAQRQPSGTVRQLDASAAPGAPWRYHHQLVVVVVVVASLRLHAIPHQRAAAAAAGRLGGCRAPRIRHAGVCQQLFGRVTVGRAAGQVHRGHRLVLHPDAGRAAQRHVRQRGGVDPVGGGVASEHARGVESHHARLDDQQSVAGHGGEFSGGRRALRRAAILQRLERHQHEHY